MNDATPTFAKRSLAATVLLLAALAGPAVHDAVAADGSAARALPTDLVRVARADGMTRVLVTLNTGVASFRPEGRLSAAESSLQRTTIRTVQQDLLGKLARSNYTLIAAYEIFPVIAMEVDAATLEYLQSAPEVQNVQEDIPVPPADTESNGIVHVAVPWSQGYDGTGWAVAVLDTGVQTSHPYLAGKTVAEACFSTTNAAQNSVSVCPNGQSTAGTLPGQSGAGAGADCTSAIDGCKHGTHVAGIAVGRDYAGGPGYDGMARGASLIAIQVFSRFTTAAACGSTAPPCVLSFASDQLAALQYLYTTVRVAFPNIASVNMSLGGGKNLAACDANALKPGVDTLRSVNVATVIATGNNGYTDAVSAPGCISTAVSVGATDDADGIASFSNRAPFMSLFAPGVNINASVPTGAFANLSGTSMATPLVAGAWALVMQKNPAWTVSQVLTLLQTTGKPIAITGGTIPRIRLGDAFGVPTLPVTVAKAFAPDSIAYGGTSTLTITLTNPGATALTGTTFTDSYPAGMTNSATPGAVTTCGGAVTAAAFYPTLTLAGGTVPANGNCTVTVQVTAIGGGSLFNTIPFRGVSSANGGENGAAGSATLTVTASNFMVQDGGFELGAAATPWTQASTNFGTPLCSVASCGTGTALRTGSWSAWFGGATAAETGTLTQTKQIGTGPKLLTFHLWWRAAPDPAATFKVYMDGAPIFSATGATSAPYSGGFTLVGIDVSGYADGNSHALKFEQINAAGSTATDIFLDDVALTNLAPSYTVSFNSNGGSAVGSQIVNYGATATLPAPPTKVGSAFAGWYSDAGLTSAFNFATPIKANLALYAKWAVAGAPLLVEATSRKTHGAAGPFDLALASTPQNPITEPRSAGAGGSHTIVFKFDRPLTGGVAGVTGGAATAGSPSFNGNEMSVPLTGVADRQYVTVTASSVTSSDGGVGGTGSVRIGFLLGDVNGSRNVTLSDILSVNGVLSQTVTNANFLRDVNLSGTLSLSDKLLVNANLTHSLPLP